MRKISKIVAALLCVCMLFGCDTEIADFEDVGDVIETAEKEAVEVENTEEYKEKSLSERTSDPDTLIQEDNQELYSMLFESTNPEDWKSFSDANKMNIIEFDASIASIELVEGKKTRYKLVLRSGDYDTNSVVGPNLIVKDVGISEACIKDLFKAGKGEVGQNVRVSAKIYGYMDNYQGIEIKLQSIVAR